jgi:tRNA A-37 threonylcarbamoyl transferase component Bud32
MERDLASDPTAPFEGESPSTVERDATFAPDEVVADRYRVVRLVGRGGMGEVYEAVDQLLGQRVALKIIRPDAADASAGQRFRRELQLARKVTHPNVCRIFDVVMHGTRAPMPVLTMELLSGETLTERVHRGRIPVAEALPLAQQMAGALDAAHAAGVIHRDFKSANVILVGGERAVVTDFGLARETSVSSSLTAGALVGSPAYVAPEQVEGHEVTPRVDIYSFGVVLYEMVTGELPFVAANPMATAMMRLREDPRPPRKLVPDLPVSWERTILACLARDPAQRPATAGDVAAALAGTRAAPRFRRRRWPWVAVVALMAGAAGTWGIATALRRPGVTVTLPGQSARERQLATALRVLATSDDPRAQKRYDEATRALMRGDVDEANRVALLGFQEMRGGAAEAGDDAPDIDDPEEALGAARDAFDQGVKAFREGQHATAAAAFLRAHATKKVPQLLFDAAKAMQKGGDCLRATETYARYLASEDIDPADREKAGEAIAVCATTLK